MLTFVICGFLSTFSGILLAARQAVGNVDLGERFLLEAFIAAMLGTVIFNGKNIITGTLMGAIFLISLINGLTLLGAGPAMDVFCPRRSFADRHYGQSLLQNGPCSKYPV